MGSFFIDRHFANFLESVPVKEFLKWGQYLARKWTRRRCLLSL